MTGERTVTGSEIEKGVVLLLGGSVVLLLHRTDPFVPKDLPQYGLVGESEAMLRVRRQIRQVAPLDVPVLLRGETGTGKELVAQAIHAASRRRASRCVTVNLAALPPTLAAAELFGAGRGAFTGADRAREGYVSRAQGGTLFLDEVGDAPSDLQVLLLRTLESGEIQPLGESRTRRVDVRWIAATDADLERQVEKGKFRAPLLYRLAGFVIALPSLRERRDDFGRLFAHLLRVELEAVEAARLLDRDRPPWISAEVVARLAAYQWPGNVRQLRNVVRQLVIAYRDQERVPWREEMESWLPPVVGVGASTPAQEVKPGPVRHTDEQLAEVLRRHRWSLQPAATELGISRASLYRRIERSSVLRTAAQVEEAEIESALERCGGDLGAAAELLEVSELGLRRRLGRR